MDKKKPILQPLLAYAGERKVLTYLSMVISGISQLLALVPFLYIWAILRDVIAGDYSRIAHYGWMAVAFAIATIVVYFGALMCSHLAAFRIAANMRKTLMRHIMTLPIGFLDALGSGKVRKWVQESTQSTETYLAHQLPDKAGMYATMIGLAVLMFLFDWRMGLLCLGTVLLAIIVMITLMTGPTLRRKLGEYNKALDVENETFIQESLSRLVKDKTVIIIAHRMRTVAGADQIVVLKDGRVAESGTPAELTASGGFYKRMRDIQQGALEWNL